MAKNWIAVASADHVRRGVDGGFMQVSHGKSAPLRRLTPGDRVVYYSPHATYGGRDALMAFTAYGIVAKGPIVEVDMGGSFSPSRRPVRFLSDRHAPIRPLLDTPNFALSGPSWGAKLRFGLREIDAASMDRIAVAMGVEAD